MTTKVQVKGHDCWITVEPFIIYSDRNAENTGKFISFFSFQEPGLLLGRQVVGGDGIVARFQSESDAIAAAQQVAELAIR